MAEMFGLLPPEMAELLFNNQDHPMAAALRALTEITQIPEEIILPQFKAMEALAKVAWNPYFHNPKLERRLNGERYAARIPGARLAFIENCGHLPALEQPNALFELIIGFARPSAGTDTRPAARASR